MTHGNDIIELVDGEFVEPGTPLSLAELCRHYAVHAEWVIELVDEGILEPEAEGAEGHSQWRFSGENCRRISIVLRMQRDLGVNLPGAALALDLLEELHTLRRLSRNL